MTAQEARNKSISNDIYSSEDYCKIMRCIEKSTKEGRFQARFSIKVIPEKILFILKEDGFKVIWTGCCEDIGHSYLISW